MLRGHATCVKMASVSLNNFVIIGLMFLFVLHSMDGIVVHKSKVDYEEVDRSQARILANVRGDLERINSESKSIARAKRRLVKHEASNDSIHDKSRKSDVEYKWSKRTLLWSIGRYTNTLLGQTQQNIFTDAFKLWEAACGLSFRFEENYETADLKIDFLPNTYQDYISTDASAQAHAFYPENGRIQLSNTIRWSANRSEGNSLFVVAAHELGHALGLGHVPEMDALMNAKYTPRILPNLSNIDVINIQRLYGPPNTAPTERNDGTAVEHGIFAGDNNTTVTEKSSTTLAIVGFVLAVLVIPVSVSITMYCTWKKYGKKKKAEVPQTSNITRFPASCNLRSDPVTNNLFNHHEMAFLPPRPNVYNVIEDDDTFEESLPHMYLDIKSDVAHNGPITPCKLVKQPDIREDVRRPLSWNGLSRENLTSESASSQYADICSLGNKSINSAYAYILPVANPSSS